MLLVEEPSLLVYTKHESSKKAVKMLDVKLLWIAVHSCIQE